jgi:molecular chaperone IbpA
MNTFYLDTKNWDRFFVGADRLVKELQKGTEWLQANATTFPPFNLKKVDENKYVIEMAVAGFTKQDIEITLEGSKLIINGELKSSEDTGEYLHRGIATRNFTRRFTLADNVVVENAEILNGILRLWLEHIIPEANKPKKIEIKEQTK